MERGLLIKYLSLIFGLILVATITLIVVSYILPIGDNYATTSSTDNSLYLIPITLDAQNGISSASVQVYNQTWLDFDGVNDYVDINNNHYFNQNFSRFSLSFWIKANSYLSQGGNSTGARIFDKPSHYTIYMKNNTGLINFDTVGLSDNFMDNPNVKPSLGQWDYFAIVYNGTQKRMYKNGYLYGIESATGNISYSQIKNISIGNLNSANGLNGSIDDLKLYNSALDDGSILYLYYQGKGLEKIKPIPVLMYHQVCEDYIDAQCTNETKLHEQMQFFKDNGFTSITDKEYVLAKNQEFNLPDRPIMFIWDDGLNNTLTAADIMSEYGFKGMSAVVTSYVGSNYSYLGSDYMNWTQVRHLVDEYNWSIMSHSVIHCYMGSPSGTVGPCNTSSEMISNLSESRQDIIENANYVPVGFVFPYNSWNNESMTNCLSYYDFCTADTNNIYAQSQNKFITLSSNIALGEIDRITMRNDTTLEQINTLFNYSRGTEGIILNLKLNSNSGTTAYDSSGNANNGTISGATWDNDGVLVSLVNGVDYTLNTATGLLVLSSEYLYDWVMSSWSYYNDNNSGRSLFNNFINGLDNVSIKLPTIIFIIVIIVLFALLVKLIQTLALVYDNSERSKL